LSIAFEPFPLARWGPLFHVLTLERPHVRLLWKRVGFPESGRTRLREADVGLFVEPPPRTGERTLELERSRMAVAMAAGHPLARHDVLGIDDVLDEPFPGGADLDEDWTAFWTLDAYRGGPPKRSGDRVADPMQGLDVVAAGRAVATIPAWMAEAVPHPGVITRPLIGGPPVTTRLVWSVEEGHELVMHLVGLAADMARALDE
jgi:DNA-binding transcriptional LysR family regulator